MCFTKPAQCSQNHYSLEWLYSIRIFWSLKNSSIHSKLSAYTCMCKLLKYFSSPNYPKSLHLDGPVKAGVAWTRFILLCYKVKFCSPNTNNDDVAICIKYCKKKKKSKKKTLHNIQPTKGLYQEFNIWQKLSLHSFHPVSPPPPKN
jgi:hypothetical protein